MSTSTPLEHDYIGLTEASSMSRASEKLAPLASPDENEMKSSCLNLKETELRLGLPGSHFPEKKQLAGVPVFGRDVEDRNTILGISLNPCKNSTSGAKRGFFDAIDGCYGGNWVLGMGKSSEAEKGAALLSPGGANGVMKPQGCLSKAAAKKDIVAAQAKDNESEQKKDQVNVSSEHGSAPAAKAQVVGWPPIRSFRKNTMASALSKNSEDFEGKSVVGCLYVKVGMDGAPYLRKVDLKNYKTYAELSSALEQMFSCFTFASGNCASNELPGGETLSERHLADLLSGSDYVLTYEDKDGDWMLVGDVPWGMFAESCRRLRIMKGSEAIGLAPRAGEKCKTRD